MYRVADVIKAGGFNTDLSLNEDTELNVRLQHFGRLLYTPDAIVYHDQRRSLSDFARRMFRFGYGRGMNRLWDLQVIPPIIGLLSLFILPVWPYIFLGILLVYLAIVLAFSIGIVLKKRDPVLMGTVPVVYVTEHVTYAAGFWYGLIAGIFVTP
jgi:GT2 family glycosyltransferase